MKATPYHRRIFPLVFFWVGLITAISFLEAWLKFQAPGVTLALGLGIGKLVFGALNKIECVLAILILSQLWMSGQPLFSKNNTLFLIILVILVLQTFWALPKLNHIADLYIAHQRAPKSNLHVYYVTMETLKLTCLILFGIRIYRGLALSMPKTIS